MEVYVDEIPENCLECKFCTNEECMMNPCIFCGDGIPNDCELNLLADHDKKVRKQVCDEIRCKLMENEYAELREYQGIKYAWFNLPAFSEVLDQIAERE